jgi:hypothetical protein
MDDLRMPIFPQQKEEDEGLFRVPFRECTSGK